MQKFTYLGKKKYILGESPIWDEFYQRLYWVDIEGQSLNAWNYENNLISKWKFNNRICSISLTTDNNIILCAFDKYFAFFNIVSKKLNILNLKINLPKSVRFNDGKTDSFGRFWCGTMSEENPKKKDASIYMLNSSLELREVYKGLYISNSLTHIKNDNGMYFSDSYTKKIYKAILSEDNKLLAEVILFRDNSMLTGAPDGSTTDEEGNLWNAEWEGKRLVRYNIDSEVLEVINVPMQRPTSCTFGGPDMDLLFITSAKREDPDDTIFDGRVTYYKTNFKGNYYNRFKIRS